ncbi:HAMP domain-containing sensor histidine kinase [Pollutimonas bauzanensis]|uniref:histidine kinase n=1 Tax=Pollutimonas bauzanensis TaxID=658167 RepID=A0A1M5YRG3_9BURK|nr:sensor histidine kinase [Pollutimonas bauzanensis]SHI14635.1 Signal transduction histidine kinase [Pollutimonas bauzanensis]
MKIPNRHSLFWKLVASLAVFCFLLIGLYAQQRESLIQITSFISDADKDILRNYARQAELAWKEQGNGGLAAYLAMVRQKEQVWVEVVDEHGRTMDGLPLRGRERKRLNFMRELDWSVGRPQRNDNTTVFLPFADGLHRLVMELPWHMNPRRNLAALTNLLHIMPVALSLLLGLMLYRIFMTPLSRLGRKASLLGAGDLSARIGAPMVNRTDELGRLAATFDHMADRLENTIELQRTLLHNLSHELRTPLSRLRVLNDKTPDADMLRQRLGYEVEGMERLISNTLQLIWLETDTPDLPLEPVDVAMLWDIIRSDACFESGWDSGRIRCAVAPGDCLARANLSGLGQVLENILRNAIRHSPPDGIVTLSARRENGNWRIELRDRGPGVPQDKLEFIFLAFARLDQPRVGGNGFGLGLSIARRMMALQGGALWAENACPGLRVCLSLPAWRPAGVGRDAPADPDAGSALAATTS